MEKKVLMEKYRPRTIQFRENRVIEDWTIKIYNISKEDDFHEDTIYENALNNLPDWLSLKNSFDAENDKIAFLIVHAGTEGVFSIINWWVGKNMLNTHIFFTERSHPSSFKMISGDGLSPCIWELEVINFERRSWIDHILKKDENPDFKAYLSDQFNGKI